MPALFSMSISLFMAAVLAASASFAVVPEDMTPIEIDARSGTAFTSPWPEMEMDRTIFASSENAGIAESGAKSAAARARVESVLNMRRISLGGRQVGMICGKSAAVLEGLILNGTAAHQSF